MASGALASISVKKETVYKTDPTGVYGAIFGHGTKITSLDKSNSVERIYGLGSRTQQINLEKQFVGSFGVEYVMSNPWGFAAFLGKGATTGPDGSGIYTHTFTEQNTLPSYAVKNNIELGATDAQQIMLGSISASKSIGISVGSPVVVSDDFVYADEIFSTTSFVAQIAETFDVFSFSHATFSLPDGTVIANVQAADISMSNSPSIIYGLGSRVGSTHADLQREYSIRASVYLTNPALFWRAFYTGGASSPFSGTAPGNHTEIPTLTITLDNGLTLGNQRQIKLAFTGIMMDSYSSSQDPTAPIMEDATFFARTLTVTALNTTATIPADWF